MPCLFAAFEICHRSHSPLCSLFQISKPTKIQVKIAQLILSPLLNCFERVLIQTFATQCDGAEAVLLSEGWLLARIMWNAAGRVYERR